MNDQSEQEYKETRRKGIYKINFNITLYSFLLFIILLLIGNEEITIRVGAIIAGGQYLLAGINFLISILVAFQKTGTGSAHFLSSIVIAISASIIAGLTWNFILSNFTW